MPALPITLVTHEFQPQRGGIATFAEEMAGAAVALGHRIEVWAPAVPPGPMEDKPWSFPVRRLPLQGNQSLGSQWRLARQLAAHRQTWREGILYLPEPGPMLAMMKLQLFPSFRPRRLLLTFHGSEILRFHRRPLARLLTRRLIDRADRISVLSSFARDLLCERFPSAAAKTVLTPGAPRSGTAAAPAPERRAGAEDAGWKPALPGTGAALAPARPAGERPAIVLTVGRLHPRKGQLQTLRALQALPEAQRARLEYWIAGCATGSRYERTLRAAAADATVKMRFLGEIPDAQMPTLYAQADIFSLTSVEFGSSVEGFGLVYLEASAHGLPVVAHAVGGVAEAVADGMTGLLIPPDQPERLTAAFARLLSDSSLRQQYGTAGLAWAARHRWTDSAERLFGRPDSD